MTPSRISPWFISHPFLKACHRSQSIEVPLIFPGFRLRVNSAHRMSYNEIIDVPELSALRQDEVLHVPGTDEDKNPPTSPRAPIGRSLADHRRVRPGSIRGRLAVRADQRGTRRVPNSLP